MPAALLAAAAALYDALHAALRCPRRGDLHLDLAVAEAQIRCEAFHRDHLVAQALDAIQRREADEAARVALALHEAEQLREAAERRFTGCLQLLENERALRVALERELRAARRDAPGDALGPRSEPGEPDDCCICLEPLEDRPCARPFPCSHLLHAECCAALRSSQPWFALRCPLCRAPA